MKTIPARIRIGMLVLGLGLAPLGSPCSAESDTGPNGTITIRMETTISDIDAEVLSSSMQLQCGNADFKACTNNEPLGSGIKCPRVDPLPPQKLDCSGTASGSIRATVPFAADAKGEATYSFDAKFDYDTLSHTHEPQTGTERCDDEFLTDKGSFDGKLTVKLEASTNSLIHGKAAGQKFEVEVDDYVLCRFSKHAPEESLRCTPSESQAFFEQHPALRGER